VRAVRSSQHETIGQNYLEMWQHRIDQAGKGRAEQAGLV
jgi:hypothetical protein